MKKIITLALALCFSITMLVAAETFTVTNSTSSKLVQLLAKESGKTQWASFGIGSGIAPGKSLKIQWADSTDGADCVWSFKAKFADGSWSAPLTLNTCEEHDIEFED